MSKIRKIWCTFRKKPYVEIISEGGMTDKGYQIELDWNNYFIDDLAKHGIEGDNDEDAVNIWLQRIRNATEYEIYQEKLMQAAEKTARGEDQ